MDIETFENNIIYNPYNETNREIDLLQTKKILNQYNVYYTIQNIDLFRQAFIHRSYVHPKHINDDVTMAVKPPNCIPLKSNSNERLEFLGDGVLECITKFYLYKRFPNEDEGFMTEKKIALVKNDHIGKLAFKIGFHHWYILSKNAEEKKIRYNYKKLGCLFEAFLGALFLDANDMNINDLHNQNRCISPYMNHGIGFQICQTFIESIFEQLVDWNDLLEVDDNYKNIFQVMMQKEFKTTPDYVVLNVDDEQRYTMGVYLCLNGKSIHNLNIEDAVNFESDIQIIQKIKDEEIDFIYFTQSTHKIKKKAEQVACQNAIALINRYSNK